jgi:hypothetical protein
MIVKVQRPLESSPDLQGDPPFLVYAEGRQFQTHVPRSKMPADVLAAIKDDAKAYFEARLRNGEWVLGRRVADQAW